MTDELDPQTGLPPAPRGHFWRVEGWRGGRVALALRKRTLFGLSSKTVVSDSVMEDVSKTRGGDYYGYDYFGPSPRVVTFNELTADDLRRTAQEILARHERNIEAEIIEAEYEKKCRAAAAKWIGDYPPKSLDK